MRKLNYLFLLCFFYYSILPAQQLMEEDSIYFNDFMTLSIEDLLNMSIQSAGKKSSKVGDTPASIVLITQSDIQKYGYHSIEEIISHIPGFYSLGDAYIYSGTNFGIRGFASPGAFNNVMIMVNGVNQMEDFSNGFSTDKINVPVQAINRIEVIRGPMAVVYGSNAFMGVINIITNEGITNEDKNTGVIQTSYGSLNSMDVFTQVKGKSDEFSFSFNGGFEETDGRIIDYDELIKEPSFTTAAVFDKTTENQLSEKAKYFNFNAKFRNISFHSDLSETKKGTMGTLPSVDFDQGWLMQILAGNIHVKYDQKLHSTLDLTLKYTHSFYNYNVNDFELVHPDFFGVLSVESSADEIEANLLYEPYSHTSIILGVHNRRAGTVERFVDVPTFGIVNEGTFIGNSPINTWSTFAEVTHNPIKRLKLVAGLRMEQTSNYEIINELTFTDTTTSLLMTQHDPSYGVVDINKPQFIPRFAAIYTINENHIIKAMYAQSKKRASFNDIDNAFDSGSTNLTFANMSTLELNYLSVLSKKVNMNISIYNNDLDNLILKSIKLDEETNTTDIKVVNGGEMKTIGGEISLQIQPLKKLRAEISTTYQQTTDYSEGMDTLTAAFAPQFLGYLKMYYDITDKVSIGIKGKFVDTMEDEFNFETKERYSDSAPSYFTLDANLHATIWKGLFVNILASNITNTQVRYVATQNTNWINKGMIGYQRRFKATLGYNF